VFTTLNALVWVSMIAARLLFEHPVPQTEKTSVR